MEMQAIPTVYNGVQMRSRAEADTARLLDIGKLRWKYEATSVLLPNGQHYRPDFLVSHPFGHGKPWWIEVRGYTTPESTAQLNAAARAVASNSLDCSRFLSVTDGVYAGPVSGAFLGDPTAAYACATSTDSTFGLCRYCAALTPLVRPVTPMMCAHCFVGLDDEREYTVQIVGGYVSIANFGEFDDKMFVRVRDIPDGIGIDEIVTGRYA